MNTREKVPCSVVLLGVKVCQRAFHGGLVKYMGVLLKREPQHCRFFGFK